MDSLKETFFAECEDLLDALQEGLADLAQDDPDPETVNSIFRAVHSIKGAAGAFALTDLVGFAHQYETVLDLIRSNKLAIEDEVLHVITRSGDVLAELVEAAHAGDGTVPETRDALIAQLVALSGDAAPPASSEADGGGDFAFEPVSFAGLEMDLELDDLAGENRFDVRFVPERGLYDNGHDPLNLFRGFPGAWEVEVRCDTDRIPELSSFDPEESYLGWHLAISGDVTEGEIRRVFAFAEGLCLLEITALTDTPEAAPEVASPDPLPEPSAGAQTPSASSDAGMKPTAAVDGVVSFATSRRAAAKADPAPEASPPEPTRPEVPKPPPEDPGAQQRGSRGAQPAPPRATLRVDPERVDRLINTVGELIINQAGIAQKAAAHGIPPNSEIMTELDEYRTLAREIQEAVMAIRAQPVKPLFQRMGRIVREAAEATGKEVDLITEGEWTEVDKTLVERLADPLTHMIRNAVDHGIESADQRIAAGKPGKGTVRLSAAHRSGHVLIEIADDGAGLNRERILAAAISKGLVPEDAKLGNAEIDNLLFMPGFSTAAKVTNLSGRGVGMDVVKTAITAMGGRVTIVSNPGQGSTFSISLPLTLAVLDGLAVQVCDQTMVLPLSAIVETILPKAAELRPLGRGGHVLSIRGDYVPVIGLGGILGLDATPFDPAGKTLVLIRTNGSPQVALAVQSISDQRQVVIKSLESNYGAIPGISAATILGDGHIALIVDPDAVVAMAGVGGASPYQREQETDSAARAAVG